MATTTNKPISYPALRAWLTNEKGDFYDAPTCSIPPEPYVTDTQCYFNNFGTVRFCFCLLSTRKGEFLAHRDYN
jgi:hypothetical protein